MNSCQQTFILGFFLAGCLLPLPGAPQSGATNRHTAIPTTAPQPTNQSGSVDYLMAQSRETSGLMGDFRAFDNRFAAVPPNRVYDRFLNITWILPPDPKDSRVIARMNWDQAEVLAEKLRARLPSLAEAKTLITRQHDAGIDAFINARFFNLNPRTKRCWTSERKGLIEPYHRGYVDFAKPEWSSTSMSEIYCVLLVESAGQ